MAYTPLPATTMSPLRRLGPPPTWPASVLSTRTAYSSAWMMQDSPLAAAFTTASTLLGVAQLGFTGQLVELDVTAALPK